jgi:HEAT repeat protein
VAEAAAAALALIADRPSLGALAAARAKATGAVKQGIDEECAQCAGQFAARGDNATAVRVYRQLIGRQEPQMVRIVALGGLAAAEGNAAVPALVAEVESKDLTAEAAARNSLYNLRGPVIDPAIVSAIGSSSGKVKVKLIMATGERGSAAAADALVKALQEQGPDVHREALKALKNVAGPAQVPSLVDVLVNASTAADRRDASQTLALVLKRSQPPQIGAVPAAYQKNTAAQARLSLLEVMGQTSSEQSLPVLREALKDSSAEIRRGAILAPTDWADAAPMPDLLDLAKTSANQSLQVLALRGYLKLVALPSQRTDAESARLLAIAQAAMADESVTKEAKAAVDKINSLVKYK